MKTRLTPSFSNSDILPTFSPDGRSVAFNRTGPPRGPFVYVVPAAGGEPREIAQTSFPRGRLAWTPQGREIIFAAEPLARDGGQPTPSSREGRASSEAPGRRRAGPPREGAPWTWPCRETDIASSIRRGR
jgi:Tol biopolymer transport system component